MDSEKVNNVLNNDFLGSIRNLVTLEENQIIITNADDPNEVKKVFENFGKLIVVILEWLVEGEDFSDFRSENRKAIERLNVIKNKIKFELNEKEVTNLQKAIKDISALLNISLNEELFILPSIKKGIKVDEVLDEVKEKGSLLSYYNDYFKDRENVKHILSKWKEADFFKGPRGYILTDAMAAHCNNQFTLSVPIFLIHIEAFFSEIFGELKWDTKRKRKELLKLITEEAEKNKISKNFLKSSFLLHIINDVMRKIDENEQTNFPNRHKILHGENITYFEDELNSTKCIILLDAISGIKVSKYKDKLLQKSQTLH